MSKLKCWDKIADRTKPIDYHVWLQKEKREGRYNPVMLVARTENGRWIVFRDTGDFGGGVSILAHPKSKLQALSFAQKYLKENDSC